MQAVQPLSAQTLAAQILAGERRAAALAINWVEGDHAELQALLAALTPRVGHAQRIGITGPPGAGKSTLTLGLARSYLQRGERVGVIAVDPSSPFDGGALLGDRIRMSEVAGDERIFIRSMASRGALGGVALASSDAADILDAWGCDRIVIETVGVGQSEFEIVRATDTTLVVLTPESGDEVQAAKAGLMEIADAFVINKSDRPGSDTLFAAMRAMLDQRQYDRDPKAWAAPLLRTVATNGAGMNELVSAIDGHRDGAKANGGYQQRRERNRQQRVVGLVNAALAKDYWSLANIKRLEQCLSTSASVPSAREIAARLLAKARDER